MDSAALEGLILLAEKDLSKFAARYSGFSQNDEHIEKSQNIICGAKKLLEQLRIEPTD